MLKANRKNALLVGTHRRGVSASAAHESLDELSELLRTAGGLTLDRIICDLREINPATFIGSGKLAELVERAGDESVHFILFDDELSPSQQRNIEKAVEKMVMDRTGLILDIFASRARSAEGKIQVELAQLQYLLPRLRGMWTDLSRQGAGIGTRGPGETLLEVDRRRIQDRMSALKKKLKKVRRTRSLHRGSRRRMNYSTAGLVGYTNAGKSTLFNALTGADAYADDALFATLDTSVREMFLAGNFRLLLSDTVGFIRKLPHQLIESFKATFEEVTDADFLLHVIDVSDEKAEERIDAVNAVLAEIGFSEKTVVHVLNKIDACKASVLPGRLLRVLPEAVTVSARTGEGLDRLREMLSSLMLRDRTKIDCAIPLTREDLVDRIRRDGHIVEENFRDGFFDVSAWIPVSLSYLFEEFAR